MSRMWHTSACKVQTNPVSGLRKPWGGWTLGSTNLEGGLHSPFPVQTKLDKEHYISSWTRNGAVEPVQNLWASSTLLGSKTTQPLETYSRSEQPNLSETIRTTLQQWEWVTSIDFKDTYFHIPIQEQSRTYQMSCPGSDIPIQSTVFRSAHCTHRAHCSSKGVETDGHTQGYNNPPVLRRLVGKSHIPPGLSPAYTRSSENMPKFRLPVQPHGRSGPTYTGPLAEPSVLPVCPVQQFMSDRFTNSHRKAISPRPTS